jgi:uncharacterized integral membrane protein
MKKLILFLSIICGSGLTVVSIYNTVVDAKSWSSDIPASIQTARDYFQHVDPRRFYEVAGPVNLILIVLTLILFWKDSVPLRFYFAASFSCYAGILILTLAYFFLAILSFLPGQFRITSNKFGQPLPNGVR